MNRRNFLLTILGIGAIAKAVKPKEDLVWKSNWNTGEMWQEPTVNITNAHKLTDARSHFKPYLFTWETFDEGYKIKYQQRVSHEIFRKVELGSLANINDGRVVMLVKKETCF